MPYDPIDPASLEGDDLTSWYLRTPDEIAQQRRAAAQQRYDEFFDDPTNAAPSSDPDANSNDIGALPQRAFPSAAASLDRSGAGPDDGARLELIGNPANPGLIREWEKKWGQDWPIDPVTGRKFDVAHIKALADGGANVVDNIRPLHPADHLAEHLANGDQARWGRRSWIARAFGGRVARALGPFAVLPDITGVLSGRIRTDSFDNFVGDMMGSPSAEDRQRMEQELQRSMNPSWIPGGPEVI
jgi:hypothetical protein